MKDDIVLAQIVEIANKEFDNFVKNQHEKNPELILKYQITMDMRTEFIEAVLLQYWTDSEVNTKEIMEFMYNRYKTFKR